MKFLSFLSFLSFFFVISLELKYKNGQEGKFALESASPHSLSSFSLFIIHVDDHKTHAYVIKLSLFDLRKSIYIYIYIDHNLIQI